MGAASTEGAVPKPTWGDSEPLGLPGSKGPRGQPKDGKPVSSRRDVRECLCALSPRSRQSEGKTRARTTEQPREDRGPEVTLVCLGGVCDALRVT